MQKDSLHIVMTSCGDKSEAERIARLVVDERLAACVSILPVFSVYRWQEKTHAEEEQMLLIKTRGELTEKLMTRIKELHSYELPEIITLAAADCERNYLGWLLNNTNTA